ncbi:MAG: hypothetical protein IPI60_09155 [Saprospiraceae bacterium]|nr:hypothetical protein [Saprospiraceae bacterium]
MKTENRDNSPEKKTEKPIPDHRPEDYYIENGLLVFTSTFHLKRGYCCGSKCRHCPFEWKDVKK